MTFSEAQRTYVVAQTLFSSLAGARLFPERATQDEIRPYVIYHLELREPDQPLSGPTMIEASVNYIAVADNYDDAFAVAEALRKILEYFPRGNMGDLEIKSCMFDETIGGYIADLDLFQADSRFTFQFAA